MTWPNWSGCGSVRSSRPVVTSRTTTAVLGGFHGAAPFPWSPAFLFSPSFGSGAAGIAPPFPAMNSAPASS